MDVIKEDQGITTLVEVNYYESKDNRIPSRSSEGIIHDQIVHNIASIFVRSAYKITLITIKEAKDNVVYLSNFRGLNLTGGDINIPAAFKAIRDDTELVTFIISLKGKDLSDPIEQKNSLNTLKELTSK